MNKSKKILRSPLLLPIALFVAPFLGCTKDIVKHEDVSLYYGFITDSITGNSLQNAELLIYQSVVDSSDSAGFYRYPTFGLSVTLSCRATGYQLQTKTGSVSKNGDSLQVDFALKKI